MSPRTRPALVLLPPGVCAVVGALLVVALTQGGVSITTDSASYVAAADSLLNEGRLLAASGQPYVLWPPVYPLLLAAAAVVSGLDPLDAARLLGAGLFAALVFGGGVCVGRRSGWGAGAAASLGLLLAAPLQFVAGHALSELPYALVLLAYLVAMDRDARSPRDGSVLLAGAFAAVAVLTRYIGVLVILHGVVTCLLPSPLPVRRRLRRASLLALPSVLAMAAWTLRNRLLVETLAGERESSRSPVLGNLGAALYEVGTWFFPADAFTASRLAVVVLALALWWATGRDDVASGRPERRWGALALGLFVVHVAGIVALRSVVEFDPIDRRLLAPASVAALLWLVAVGTQVAHARGQWFRIVRVGGAVLALAWVVPAVLETRTHVSAPSQRRAEVFTGSEETRRQLASVASAECPDAALYSPDGWKMYLATRRAITRLRLRDGLPEEGCVVLYSGTAKGQRTARRLVEAGAARLEVSEEVELYRVR